MPYRLTIKNRHIDTILNEIKTKIPDTETSIDLSTQYEIEGNMAFLPNAITAENYIRILQELSKQVTSLDMTHNHLSRFGPDLITVTQNLPENLTSLTWHDSELYKLPADLLVAVFKVLPKKLSSFSLRGNILYRLSAIDFVKAMQALPEGIETLDLSGNLYKYSVDELVSILKSLPSGLKSLDLGICDFCRFTGEELVKIIGALNENLIKLSLNYNGFDPFDPHWPDIMKAMPQNLHYLDLDFNEFDKLPADSLAKMFKQAPENLSDVKITYGAPVDPLEFIIDNEINRMMNTHSSKKSVWVSLGVIDASDAKINAFNDLKVIIGNRLNSATFKEDLTTWYGKNIDCIKMQRNKIHSFFQPEHKASTQKIVEEMFAHFGVAMEAKPSIHNPE